MSKTKKLFIAAGIFCILAVVFFCIPKSTPQPQALLASEPALLNNGQRSQCIANFCYSAAPNLECKQYDGWCETIVMGLTAGDYDPTKKSTYTDLAQFFMQRVERNTDLMEKAGVEIGDTVERVNGIYAGSDLEFAKLVLRLPKGTVLLLWRKGERVTVTL
jgi:hypothetical protein